MKRTKQAVILAGGMATRLGDLAQSLPKPMMDISGRPFLQYLISNLGRQGIEEIVLLTGHLSDVIEGHFGNGSGTGLSIRYSREAKPLGTGGALKSSFDILQDRFFLLNGDTILDVNFSALDTLSSSNTIALRHVSDASRYGSVEVSGDRVLSFREKCSTGSGLISGGVLCINKQDVLNLPDGKCSIEFDLLPVLAANSNLSALITNGYFIDIGLPETLDNCKISLPEWEAKPIAFLDRDGVLNRDTGHVHKVNDFIWVDGAAKAIRYLNESGLHVVLITNQAGIAKGMYSEQQFLELTDWMKYELWEQGAHIDAVYYCPFHPDGSIPEYSRQSPHRKPEPGMLLSAMEDIPHNKKQSFFIGNMPTDRAAAVSCGIDYHEFTDGDLYEFVKRIV